MANADGYVLPKPGIPKTLGILNVIFGVMLLLGGICGLASPLFIKFADNFAKQTQANIEAQQKEQVKQFDDRLKAAKTEAETKTIEQQRDNLVAAQARVPKMDMSAATDVINDPTIMGFSYVSLAVGLILNILLLVSGILLIRLSATGRTLAIWWALPQIVATVIFTAANIAIVQPVTKIYNDKSIAKMEVQAQGKPPGSPEVTALQMTKMMAGLAIPLAVGQGVLSLIYPALVLILLNTAGARAALVARKPAMPDTF